MRNAYGELVRALGMSLILALQRTTRIRKSYPTGRHIRSSLGMAPRRPFPSRQQQENGDYPNLFVLIAMGFMGSLCGGNLPLLPTWIGSLAGAGTFVLSTTPPTAQVSVVVGVVPFFVSFFDVCTFVHDWPMCVAVRWCGSSSLPSHTCWTVCLAL